MAASKTTVQECLFCQVVSLNPADLPWHDRPLTRVPGIGAVIPGLGAFVPGYVLVFPEQHVESVNGIAQHALTRFQALVSQTVEAVRTIFGPVTVFEHGSCPREDIRRSACLDHAHMQILPGAYALQRSVDVLTKVFPTSQNTLSQEGYLYLEEPDSASLYVKDPGISQFFRRRVAESIGIADEWDYLMFPRWDNVRETIRRLTGVL